MPAVIMQTWHITCIKYCYQPHSIDSSSVLVDPRLENRLKLPQTLHQSAKLHAVTMQTQYITCIKCCIPDPCRVSGRFWSILVQKSAKTAPIWDPSGIFRKICDFAQFPQKKSGQNHQKGAYTKQIETKSKNWTQIAWAKPKNEAPS